jgi:hypothetical protein
MGRALNRTLLNGTEKAFNERFSRSSFRATGDAALVELNDGRKVNWILQRMQLMRVSRRSVSSTKLFPGVQSVAQKRLVGKMRIEQCGDEI